jgi:hypothetical protein
MSSTSFSDIYEQAETGAANGIAGGTYDVTIEDVRIKADTRVLFLDMQVLNGPSAGKTVQVKINIPGENTKPGAFFYYRNRIAGFMGPALKQAFDAADRAPTDEAALSIIADAIRGQSVTAEVTLVSEGQYKGNNELTVTKPLTGAAPAVAPVAASAPVAAPVAAEASSNSEVPF